MIILKDSLQEIPFSIILEKINKVKARCDDGLPVPTEVGKDTVELEVAAK